MRKIIRTVCFTVIVLCIVLMSAVVYGFYALPDEFYSLSGSDIDVGFYSCSLPDSSKNLAKSVGSVGEYKVNISLFNKIPVKISNLTVSDRRYVVPSGEIIGLRIFTKGVMIVATDNVDTEKGSVNPSKAAKLLKGDVISSIDGCKVENSAQVEQAVSSSGGKNLSVEYVRNGSTFKTSITPAYSVSENRYKTGLWIRDSAAGIGTMTFYEKSTGFFACLGHAVCDIDTGEVLPLSNGDIVDAAISGCVKGKTGTAGELCGNFKSRSLGVLRLNDEFGVYGYLDSADNSLEAIPVALKSEVRTGSAQIISTVENETKAYYDIEIEKLNPDDKEGKNMIIKIKDSKLIEKTGGIVQGMSGSPIIQDGRLVGAVTHVFLNDPTKGYGIFAETMLKKSYQAELNKAG
ncbi:MAG: SpoIVB peptidase [Clostridia bacterium]|nr:SpoIVB peptidase [Clostridia bacterium]